MLAAGPGGYPRLHEFALPRAEVELHLHGR